MKSVSISSILRPLTCLALSFVGTAWFHSEAGVILQSLGGSVVAFQAENASTLVAGAPENWTIKTDSQASGGRGLIADGTNSTGDSPHSFAQYQIKFATAGTYFLYYRWRADESRTAGDVFTANSSWLPKGFGASSTPGTDAQANYYRTICNDSSAPANNAFNWRHEVDPNVYTVEAGQVGTVLTLSIGTREAGMIFDRFVFSTSDTLTDAQLDALSDSDTDVVDQSANDNYIAFEAESSRAILTSGTPENWERKAEANASGGGGLIAAGTNSTGDSPHSFAQYQLRFNKAGTYTFYYRWRADEARTAGDVFTANSSWIPKAFNAGTTPGAAAQENFYRTISNDSSAPANNAYHWRHEVDPNVYTIEPAQVGTVVLLTIGTREAGMIFDRFVFSTVADLTDPQLDALANTGAVPVAPEISNAAGSSSLKDVTLKFSRPLQSSTIVAGNFTLSGGVTVSTATLDPDDARRVTLTTSTQTEGTPYTVTVTNVKDTSGTSVAANTKATFTAWKRFNGWVTKEIYFGIGGDNVSALTDAAKFQARQPDRIEYIRSFSTDQDPLTDNYGARLSAFFQPPSAGTYEFAVYNDNDAQLSLSTDESPTNLASLLDLTTSPRGFNTAGTATSATLSTDKRYLLQGLLKQGGGDVYLHVGARKTGDANPITQDLAGDRVSTWINPDLGHVTFKTPPTNVTAVENDRGRFAIQVEAATGPIYYQWQVNGANIPGATRAVYYTPVLSSIDSGKKYRCIVSVAGIDSPSSEATLIVAPGTGPAQEPYLGINFVGGGNSLPGNLTPQDVAGVVLQENWNNLSGTTFDEVVLYNAKGVETQVNFSSSGLTETWYSGTITSGDASGVLLQGFVSAGASTDPVTLTLKRVPAGTYQVIVYSVGFNFSPAYEQNFSVTGDAVSSTIFGRAQTGLQFVNSPNFVQIKGTDAAQRGTGNYAVFSGVKPAADGSIEISVAWAGEGGNGHQPAINAIQLTRATTVVAKPTLSVARDGADLVITYTGTLQASDDVASGYSTSAGTSPRRISPSGSKKFYRATQ